MGKDTGLRPRVTLAALLGLLDSSARVFVIHRLGPHEAEAAAEGTVEELRATRCVEVCGDSTVERVSADVEDWPETPTPVLIITIGGKEAGA